MATLSELQDALKNADAAGDQQAAQALANEIVRQRMPWTAPTASPIPSGPLSVLPASVQAGVIGAGRQGDQLIAGVKQFGINADIAARQAMGMDTAQQFRDLNALDQVQSGNQPVYDALKRQFPVSTALGEAAPSLAIPMGAPTTAARLALPAIGMGTLGLAGYGDLPTRLVRGAVDATAGLGGGVGGEIAGRVVQPIRDVADSVAQAAAKNAAAKIGSPLLPSQLTGNPTLALIEDSLAHSPGSAGVIGDVLGQQRAAVGRAAASAIGQPGSVVTQDVVNNAKRAMGSQYDAFRAQIPNGMPVTPPVLDAVDTALGKLSSGSTQAPGKAGALSMLGELKDTLYATKALPPEQYSTWVSDLSAAARQAQNPQVSSALKSVGAVMDKEARGPLNADWKALDQAYAAARTLEKSKAYNPETGDVFSATLANYMRAHPSGANATSLADAAAFGKAVPQIRAGSPTFQRGEIGLRGAINALWRYPLAKALTSQGFGDYLANGLLAGPQASAVGSLLASKSAIPLAAMPTLSLLGPLVPSYQ